MKYKQIRGGGRSGRYKKGPDTDVKRRLELEIAEIDQQGTLPDDDWMDAENVRAYLEYLHTGRTRLLQALQWKPNTVVRTKAEFDIEQSKQGRVPDNGWLEEENVRAYLDSVCDDLEKMFAQVKPHDILSGSKQVLN